VQRVSLTSGIGGFLLMDDTRLSGVDPRRAIFISYRQSDGTIRARKLARLLRAAGVPVWRDREDLPPGDTELRLQEALSDGLSGAVLLVTPHIEQSLIVRNLESPKLLTLNQDRRFQFVVANQVVTKGGHTDFDAPDRLLQKPAGTLSRLNQMPATTDSDLALIARAVLMERMDQLRRSDSFTDGRFIIDLRTRTAPHSADFASDLPIRLHPAAAGRLPDPQAIHDLKEALPFAPQAIERAQVQSVTVEGAAHLSVALALGCAIPATFLADVVATGRDGQSWTGAQIASDGENPRLIHVSAHKSWPSDPHRNAVLAYVDMIPGRSDDAYRALLEGSHQFLETIHVELRRRDEIAPSDATDLTSEVAGLIRALSRRHGNAELHLLLYVPFPVAVLLGRLLNTLKVVVYEWDSGDSTVSSSRYTPILAITPTNGGSLIGEIHASQNSSRLERFVSYARALSPVRSRRRKRSD
jgi:hypothetical protein